MSVAKMAITNFTGEEKQTTYVPILQFCSPELTGGIHKELICLIALNIFLSVSAFLGNSLILVSLHKNSSLRSPSKLMFRCLAASDICVGIISEPVIVVYWISVVIESWNMCYYAAILSHLTGYILGSVSLLTLTAIGVDRRLALLLGFRYKYTVTLKRTRVTVITLWVLSIVGTTLYFLNYLITLWYGNIIILFCLVTCIYTYTMIFRFLRRRQSQVQKKNRGHRQPNQRIRPLNIERYKKSVSNVLWIQLALVICYLPYAVAQAVLPVTPKGLSRPAYLVRAITLTLVFLNSSLNPVLYFWRIREVRRAVKNTLKQICCN